MQPKPVPTEVPVDVGDKVIMIPNDEALKDSATFIRAFEHATLVCSLLCDTRQALMLTWI
jgi:hypothetical protein